MCKLFANRTTIATVSQQIRPLQANLTRCLHNVSLCYANVLKLASRRGCGCGGRCWWLGWSTLLKSFLCRCMSAGKTAWALSHHYQMPPPLTTSSVTYIRMYVCTYFITTRHAEPVVTTVYALPYSMYISAPVHWIYSPYAIYIYMHKILYLLTIIYVRMY